MNLIILPYKSLHSQKLNNKKRRWTILLKTHIFAISGGLLIIGGVICRPFRRRASWRCSIKAIGIMQGLIV
jgi:hypothetical protein